METAVGLVIGVIVTIVVANYYFRRSTNKSLGVYETLVSEIFEGIAPDVSERLRFTYEERDVDDLMQLEFLIANDGEKAISNVIEPLQLILPDGVELLDASVLYRYPNGLETSIDIEGNGENGRSVKFDFPLLNKGDFFLVKILLSGKLKRGDISFRLLADDLPRKLKSKRLPPTAFKERELKIEWLPVIIGLVFFAFAVWLVWSLLILKNLQPDLFPIPWEQYAFSIKSLMLLAPAAILVVVFGIFGLMLIVVGGFDKFSATGPRFPLPRELRYRHYPFPLSVRLEEQIQHSELSETKEREE